MPSTRASPRGPTPPVGAIATRAWPYFFSDQYDLGMEYVGYSGPGDAIVVRGSLADREFIAFWHRDGIVTAAMNVNVWDVVEDLKAIVAGGRALEPGHLADPAVNLADLA